jgi:hypothetical protein
MEFLAVGYLLKRRFDRASADPQVGFLAGPPVERIRSASHCIASWAGPLPYEAGVNRFGGHATLERAREAAALEEDPDTIEIVAARILDHYFVEGVATPLEPDPADETELEIDEPDESFES